MGNRSNLFFKNGNDGIGIYAHNAGAELAEVAASVVKNPAFKSRLGDPSYALRIGVETALECLGSDGFIETGFGLWTANMGPDDNDSYPYIVIDVLDGQVYVTKSLRNPREDEVVPDPSSDVLKNLMLAK